MLFWFCDFPISIVFLKVSNVAFLVFCMCLAPTAVGTFLPLSASNGTLGRNWFSLLTNTWALAGSPKAPGKNLWFCCGRRTGWWNPCILELICSCKKVIEECTQPLFDAMSFEANTTNIYTKYRQKILKELSLGKVQHLYFSIEFLELHDRMRIPASNTCCRNIKLKHWIPSSVWAVKFFLPRCWRYTGRTWGTAMKFIPILLMEEILHQLIYSLSHYLQGLCIPGGAGFLPSTVPSMYGIFTYICFILYGKCREICHTWMLWDSVT